MHRLAHVQVCGVLILAVTLLILLFAPLTTAFAQFDSDAEAVAFPSGTFGVQAQQQANNPGGVPGAEKGKGIVGEIKDFFGKIFASILVGIGVLFVGVSAFLLNMAIAFGIIGFDDFVRSTSGIVEAWKVVRDLMNLFFIFALLFIGIATILRLESYGYKQLLAKLIIAALLVNFSLFFAQVVIDVSNVAAISFHNQILDDTGSGAAQFCGGSGVNLISCAQNGIALEMMKQSGVLGVFEPFQSGEDFFEGDAPTIAVSVTMFIFLMVMFGVFFAAAMLLIIRIVVLIIIMILSPVGIAAMILPQTAGYAKKWWGALFSQSFFAPAFFLLLLISFKVMKGISPTSQFGAGTDIKNLAVGVSTGDATGLAVMFNFAIFAGFISASIMIAKQLGAYGADSAIKIANRARNWGFGVVGRNTIGRAGYMWANNPLMRELEARNPAIGKVLRAPGAGLSNIKFGSERGFQEALEATKKSGQEQLDRVRSTGPLVQGVDEKPEDFEKRKRKAEEAAKKRQDRYIEKRTPQSSGPLSSAIMSSVLPEFAETQADIRRIVGDKETEARQKAAEKQRQEDYREHNKQMLESLRADEHTSEEEVAKLEQIHKDLDAIRKGETVMRDGKEVSEAQLIQERDEIRDSAIDRRQAELLVEEQKFKQMDDPNSKEARAQGLKVIKAQRAINDLRSQSSAIEQEENRSRSEGKINKLTIVKDEDEGTVEATAETDEE